MNTTASDVLAGRAAWSLDHGDCRALLRALPDKCVDHVITDPPYSEHTHVNVRSGLRDESGWKPGGKSAGIDREVDIGFGSLSAELRAEVAREVARLVRRWALVFSDIESAHLWRRDLSDAGLRYIRTGVWVKSNAAPQFSGDRPASAVEAITICHAPVAGKMEWNGGGKAAVWQTAVARERDDEHRVHPTQKPELLMRQLVEDFTAEGDVILDPFAGSGTTGAAALALGRRFVGMELDTTHAATARARLAGLPYKQPKVVAQVPQLDLLGGAQ